MGIASLMVIFTDETLDTPIISGRFQRYRDILSTILCEKSGYSEN